MWISAMVTSGGAHGCEEAAHLGGELLGLARKLGGRPEHLGGRRPGLLRRGPPTGECAWPPPGSLGPRARRAADFLGGRGPLLHRRRDRGGHAADLLDAR